MAETIDQIESPEEEVFGNAFSITRGKADDETIKAFFQGRLAQIRETGSGWLPRILDADHGVCADLYKNGKVVATLEVEYGYGATVYTTSDGGNFGDTVLCNQTSFEDAVTATHERFDTE